MGELENKFIVPPFSVLDTRQGYWQKRKREWINIGIKSEVGRDATCLPDSFVPEKYGHAIMEGRSIFDPLLCELMYKWFAPKNGKILDPFAGGSVRGVVADKLGYDYLGIELSAKQVEANKQQAKDLEVNPEWRQGDSNKLLDDVENESADLVFSCPPYFNLEEYSDHPDDISNKTYDEFLNLYESIIKKAIDKLKPNRFAIFVVGEVRDKDGFYIGFVSDTVRAFQNSGVRLYNDVILVNVAGTMPLRVGNMFPNNRKISKGHQNVLIFYKGEVSKIREELGILDLSKEDIGSKGNQSTLMDLYT